MITPIMSPANESVNNAVESWQAKQIKCFQSTLSKEEYGDGAPIEIEPGQTEITVSLIFPEGVPTIKKVSEDGGIEFGTLIAALTQACEQLRPGANIVVGTPAEFTAPTDIEGAEKYRLIGQYGWIPVKEGERNIDPFKPFKVNLVNN